MQKYIEYFNITKLNLIQKNKFFYLPFDKKSILITKLMINYNIAIGYKKCIFFEKIKIKVFLNSSAKSDFLKNLCKPANKVYVKHFYLSKYHAKHLKSKYILSTSKGLIDSKKAEKNKVGGILLFKLN